MQKLAFLSVLFIFTFTFSVQAQVGEGDGIPSKDLPNLKVFNAQYLTGSNDIIGLSQFNASWEYFFKLKAGGIGWGTRAAVMADLSQIKPLMQPMIWTGTRYLIGAGPTYVAPKGLSGGSAKIILMGGMKNDRIMDSNEGIYSVLATVNSPELFGVSTLKIPLRAQYFGSFKGVSPSTTALGAGLSFKGFTVLYGALKVEGQEQWLNGGLAAFTMMF